MTQSKPKFTHIVITGASSGIGEALALHYATSGVRLTLTGRNAERLTAVAGLCRARGAAVEDKIICVTDRAAMQSWLAAIDDQHPVDLVIANAGISAGMGESKTGESPDQVQRLFDINLHGVLNTIDPLLPRMIARRAGNIALMSSLAAYRGWPGAPAYCATKAAVKVYGEGMRGSLAHTGIKVHVICPGFVTSRITAVNKFPMPFILPADKAARIIAKGIERNKGRISFPAPVHFVVWLCSVLPDALGGRVLRFMPAKGAEKII